MAGDLRYCLFHEREVEIVKVNETTEDVHFIEVYKDGGIPCFGPFANCSPPPPLSEEDWNIILEQEYYRYAN